MSFRFESIDIRTLLIINKQQRERPHNQPIIDNNTQIPSTMNTATINYIIRGALLALLILVSTAQARQDDSSSSPTPSVSIDELLSKSSKTPSMAPSAAPINPTARPTRSPVNPTPKPTRQTRSPVESPHSMSYGSLSFSLTSKAMKKGKTSKVSKRA
eukprot:scaffold3277_cov110-Skeletonema_dohrnii-CCMP3373.AAC.1